MKCDKCDKPAAVHEVTIKNGVKREIHLCAEHAAELGLVHSKAEVPINQMLTQFVISQSSGSAPKQAAGATDVACPTCGMTFSQFRRSGTLGCGDCYDALEKVLGPLVERAHEGATHHVGKTPCRAGGSLDRQLELRRLVGELDRAIAAEQYERAAQIRDRLLQYERGEDVPPADVPAPPASRRKRPGPMEQ